MAALQGTTAAQSSNFDENSKKNWREIEFGRASIIERGRDTPTNCSTRQQQHTNTRDTSVPPPNRAGKRMLCSPAWLLRPLLAAAAAACSFNQVQANAETERLCDPVPFSVSEISCIPLLESVTVRVSSPPAAAAAYRFGQSSLSHSLARAARTCWLMIIL